MEKTCGNCINKGDCSLRNWFNNTLDANDASRCSNHIHESEAEIIAESMEFLD